MGVLDVWEPQQTRIKKYTSPITTPSDYVVCVKGIAAGFCQGERLGLQVHRAATPVSSRFGLVNVSLMEWKSTVDSDQGNLITVKVALTSSEVDARYVRILSSHGQNDLLRPFSSSRNAAQGLGRDDEPSLSLCSLACFDSKQSLPRYPRNLQCRLDRRRNCLPDLVIGQTGSSEVLLRVPVKGG